MKRRQFLLALPFPFVASACVQGQTTGNSSALGLATEGDPPVFPVGSFGAAGIMGANLQEVTEFHPERWYRNLAYNSARMPDGITLDSNFWPNEAGNLGLGAAAGNCNGRLTGTYQCQVFLPGTRSSSNFASIVSTTNASAAVIGNGSNGGAAPKWLASISAGAIYSDQQAGSFWSFTLVMSQTNVNVALAFTSGWSFLQVMLPQYTGLNGNTYGPYTPDPYQVWIPGSGYTPQSLWNTEVLDLYKNYSILRFMQWQQIITLGNPIAYVYGGTYHYGTVYAPDYWGNSVTGPSGYGGNPSAYAPGDTVTCTVPSNSFAIAQSGQTYSVCFNYNDGTPAHNGLSSSTYTITSADVSTYGPITSIQMFPQVMAFADAPNVSGTIHMPDTQTYPAQRSCIYHRSNDDVIDFANTLAAYPGSQLKAIWVSTPAWASFKSLANNGWHATAANRYATKLNSNLKLYLELSNEVWNFSYQEFFWFAQINYQGNPTNGADNSPNYGYTWAFSQMVPIWRSAFGESGAITASSRVRPVFGGFTAGGAPPSTSLIAGLVAAVNGTSPWSSSIMSYSDYVYAIALNFYVQYPTSFVSPSNGCDPGQTLPNATYPTIPNSSMNLYDWNAMWQAYITNYLAGQIKGFYSYFNPLGVKICGYEGGPWGGGGYRGYSAQEAAALDPSCQPMINSLYQTIYANGMTDVLLTFQAEATANQYTSNWCCYNTNLPYTQTATSTGIHNVFNAPL